MGLLDTLKAFPTAYGDGADVITGGRGGIKFYITTLSTSNIQTFIPASGGVEAHYTGSFSGAFLLNQTRHIIPRISGNINGLNLSVSSANNFTYHGHLAPDGGLRLINSTLQIANTSNFIIRHLTCRDGNTAVIGQDDNIFLNRCSNAILDHVSVCWSGDEGISFFSGTSGVTYNNIIMQYCLIGQGRNNHNRGNITGTVSPTNGIINASFNNNLWVTFARTPNVTGSNVKSYNGVVYDWLARTTNIAGDGSFDEINRYYKPGPNTVTVGVNMMNQWQNLGSGYGTPSIYTAGNIVEGYLTNPAADNRFLIWSLFDNNNFNTLPASYFRSSPLPQNPATAYVPTTAIEGYNRIVVNREIGHNRYTSATGTSLRYQDSIDEHYTDAVQNGTNPILSESAFIHPSVTSNTPYTDTNKNGIYDNFDIENTSVYDDFEFFSHYLAGDFDSLNFENTVPNVILNDRFAFPTARGFGKNTVGGRGGQILHVNNLNDSGPGSLREALLTPGPRVIVFDVAGDLNLTTRQLFVNQPNVTIAGQTAPGNFTIRTDNVLPGPSTYGGTLEIRNGEIILRYITIRETNPSQATTSQEADRDLKGIRLRGFGNLINNVIIDHCSLSHAKDEIMSVRETQNLTVQQTIFLEATGSGSYLSGATDGFRVKATLLENAFLHSYYRNPLIGYGLDSYEIINNIIQGCAVSGIDVTYGSFADILGNVLRQWDDSEYYGKNAFSWATHGYGLGAAPHLYPDQGEFYVRDTMIKNPSQWIDYNTNPKWMRPQDVQYLHPTRVHADSDITEWANTIEDVEDRLLNTVGNSLYRDVEDTKGINDYINGANRNFINPVNKSTVTRPANYYVSNPDIPEFFVQQHNISSSNQIITNWDFGTYTVTNNAGYTAFEMYLAFMAGDLDKLAGQTSEVVTPPVEIPVNSKRFKRNSDNTYLIL